MHLCNVCDLHPNALSYVAVPPGPPTDILVSTTATEANVTWKAPLFIGELFSKDDFSVCWIYYMAEEFCGRKTSPSLTTFVLQKHFTKSIFSQCSKGCYVIINIGNIICVQNFSPNRTGGESSENLLLAKISSSTVGDNSKVS